MRHVLSVNTFWIIDLFYLVLKISNRFYIQRIRKLAFSRVVWRHQNMECFIWFNLQICYPTIKFERLDDITGNSDKIFRLRPVRLT